MVTNRGGQKFDGERSWTWDEQRIFGGSSERHLTFALYSPKISGMAITRRQHEVYDFISRFVAENGYSPSFEEIREGLKLNSLATVHKHITNLNHP